jgi:hypothetical protein
MNKAQMISAFKNALTELNVAFTYDATKVMSNGVTVTYRKDEYGGYLFAQDPNDVTLGMFESVNDREHTDPNRLADMLKAHQDFLL